jgi:hypothetical protein
MKKLSGVLSIVLVLAMISIASAAAEFRASNMSPAIGATVGITLYTDTPAGSMTLQEIVETPAIGGTVGGQQHNAGFTWADFTVPGEQNLGGGVLIKNATGMVGFGDPKVTGDAYGFDYTVPNLPALIGTTVSIGPGAGTNNVGGAVPSAVTLNIVPEPMTIVLLGLGGLFLRRRK